MQALFLTYPGVTGEVTITGYENLIACEKFEMKTSSGTLGATQLGDRSDSEDSPSPQKEVTIVGVDSISIDRKADQATPKFFQLACGKKDAAADGETVKLVICRALDKAPTATSGTSATSWYEPFINVTLKNAHITSHDLTLGLDDLSESITIGFKEITLEYITYKNGKKTGNVSVTVNVANPTSSA